MLRNLHFAGPLSASLQNNTDTLEIDCDSYEKAERAERHPVPHGEPGDPSNLRRLGALLHERASGRGDRGQQLQRRRLLYENPERLEVLSEQRKPRQRRGVHPGSRQRVHPQANVRNPAESSAGLELPLQRHDHGASLRRLYSKAEADGRYLSSTGYGWAPRNERQRRLQRSVHGHSRCQRRAQTAEGHLAAGAPGLEPHPIRNRHRADLRRLDQGGGRRAIPRRQQHQRSSGSPGHHHAGQLRPCGELPWRRPEAESGRGDLDRRCLWHFRGPEDQRSLCEAWG